MAEPSRNATDGLGRLLECAVGAVGHLEQPSSSEWSSQSSAENLKEFMSAAFRQFAKESGDMTASSAEGATAIGEERYVLSPPEILTSLGSFYQQVQAQKRAGGIKAVPASLPKTYPELPLLDTQTNYPDTLSEAVVESALSQAVKHIKIDDDLPCLDLFFMDTFRFRLQSLQMAFSSVAGERPICTHALAVKANPIASILREAQQLGAGAECASFGEVVHALQLGFPPRDVVFDSPCKTEQELRSALRWGCTINLDNEDELHLTDQILKQEHFSTPPAIGLRINPVVGAGTLAYISTATGSSKFGVPLTEDSRQHVLSLFHTFSWLSGLHVHVGSQGCSLDLLVKGVRRIFLLAEEINDSKDPGNQQIRTIDIGGGLSTNYDGFSHAHSYDEYARALAQGIPGLFDGRYHIITEFGRSMLAKCGVTVSKVCTVKTAADGGAIAVLHVGSNQFIREAYFPDQWKHRISVYSPEGRLKSHRGDNVKKEGEGEDLEARGSGERLYQLAGPLCFSGDIIAKDVLLPPIEKGDLVLIHDTSSYTMAMYSRYNSKPASAVYGGYVDPQDNSVFHFELLKPGETLDDVLRFWRN